MVKGFIIGIAKIIPGVSGAILSISFGVYERILDIIGHPLKLKFDDLKFLFFLLAGAGFGIVLLCNGVKWCLNSFYFPTMLFFIGLIIGGIPEITNEIRDKKFSLLNVIIFIFSFILILMLTNLNSGSVNSNNHYFLMGIIESLTTIIPGISGTAIFMALGWYESLLDTINMVLTFRAPFHVGFYFIFGFIISTIMISRILNFVFKKYKVQAYFCVMGFMCGSLWCMFSDLLQSDFGFLDVFFGIILFTSGIFSTIKINNLFSKF